MNELQLIERFRGELPRASDETRRQARELLARQFERRSFLRFPPLRRRRLLIWAAVALGACILAGSALAFGDSLLDSIRGKPAPQDVRRDFGMFQNTDVFLYDAGLVPAEARGVFAFRTSAGRASIWAAPSVDGGRCLWVKFPDAHPAREAAGQSPGGTAGCQRNDKELEGRKLKVAAVVGPAPTFVVGYAAPDVRRVEIHLLEGGVRRARLEEGVFAVGTPEGLTPTTAVAFDRKGRRVGRDKFWPQPPPAPAVPAPKRIGDPFQKLTAEEDGHRVSVSISRATRAGLCFDIERTDLRPESYCEGGPVIPSGSPIRVLGLWWGPPVVPGEARPAFWGYVFGRTPDDVASLEVRFEDGGSEAVPLEDRFFLVLATGERTQPGHRLLLLVGRDDAGRVVATRRLDRAED
jgi:hypothetical protein